MGKCKVCNNTKKMVEPCPLDCEDGMDKKYGDLCEECDGKGVVYSKCRYCTKKEPKKIQPTQELEDDEEYEKGFNFTKLIIGVAVFTAFYYFVVRDPAAVANIENQYEILSVYIGAVQALDLSSGKQVQFMDQELVQKALNGSIKKGDVLVLK